MRRSGTFIALIVVIMLAACIGNSPRQAASPTASQNTPPSGMEIVPSPTIILKEVEPTLSPTPDFTPTPSPTPLLAMPLFGSEPHHPEQDVVLSLLANSGAQIVRLNGVLWYKVEPQEGQYNWAALQNLDSALQELAIIDIDVILIVRGTPDWAQKVSGSSCGPIAQEKFEPFVSFMTQLVQRYSAPPYNVKYWELGNEPDVAPELVSSDSVFGCWGDSQDPNYGGGYYAEMLKAVYPAVKLVDPEAQVLVGGLLLDCDPYFPPEGKDCLPARFLDGILANGGGDYFDIVSFHGYPPYVSNSLSWDWEFPGWKERGGVVVGKIQFLREVMTQYGVDKPLFLTESSLICPEWNQQNCLPPDDQFFQSQAEYVVRLFVRNWALGVYGTIWYDFEGQGWRYGGLVGSDPSNPKLSYQAFKFLNEKLAGMEYFGEVSQTNGIEGYSFVSSNHRTWVLWSQDESPQTLDLPSDIIAAYDIFGQPLDLGEKEFTITSPVYIDMAP